jgi:hypothetical protein
MIGNSKKELQFNNMVDNSKKNNLPDLNSFNCIEEFTRSKCLTCDIYKKLTHL